MENKKIENFRILWFDDDFAPKSQNENYNENITREGFQEDVAYAADYGLEVIGAYNFNQFRELIESNNAFQAVIFDLKGLDENDVFNDMVMPKAYKMVENLPNIEIFVYSSNINSERFQITLNGLKEKNHVFNKGLGVDPLYKRIKEVLSQKLHFYKNHQDCLYLFNHGYLDPQRNKGGMDELLENYNKNNPLYSPYNNMRQILENMLFHLESIGIIWPIGAKDSEGDRFNPLMRCLSEGYNDKTDDIGNTIISNDGKKVRDFNKPLVAFELCRREFKYTLNFLGNITNRYSHFLKENPDYLSKHDADGCNLYIQNCTYQAFWAAMKWYYSFAVEYESCGRNLINMKEKYQKKHDDKSGVLEYDSKRNKYYCGKYFIKWTDINDKGIKVGDEIEIVKSAPNRIEDLRSIYPMIALEIKRK